MAKRKRRNRQDPDDETSRPNKKQKNTTDNDAAPQSKLTSQQATNALPLPDTTSREERIKAEVAALQPPPGMSKGQRKRWRKRQLKEALETSHSKSSSEQHTQKPPARSAAPTGNIGAGEGTSRPRLRHLAVTALLPTSKKQWHYATADKKAESSKALTAASRSMGGGLHTDNATKRKSAPTVSMKAKLKQYLGRSISQKSENPESSPRRSSSEHTSESDSEGSLPMRGAGLPSLSSRLLPNLRVPNQPAETSTLSTSKSLRNNLTIPALGIGSSVSTFRKSSVGNKATSVPTHAVDPNVKETFKRFSAFVSRHGEESSGDESEDSEDESRRRSTWLEGPSHDLVSVENLGRHEQEPRDSKMCTDLGIAVSDKEAEPEDGANAKQPDKDKDNTALPKFSETTSRGESSSGSSWPANVGIKRNISFPSQGHTESRPVWLQVAEHGVPTRNARRSTGSLDPLPTSDDESDILQSIDEVSKNVFGSTRPLSKSKTPISPEPEKLDRADGTLTTPSSDRRVTRSVYSLEKAAKHLALNDLPIDRETPITVFNTLHVPGPQVTNVEEPHLPPAISVPSETESMSDNIDVAIGHIPDSDPDIPKSSSSLSVLSRTPSPPAVLHNLEIGTEDVIDVHLPSRDDIAPTLETSIEDSQVPKKKRKMTGRTSKHFSTPTKRSKRLRSSSNVEQAEMGKNEHPELEQANEADTEGVGASNENPEAPEADISPLATRSSTKLKRKGTRKRSEYFTPSKPALDPNIIDRVDFFNSTGKKKRVPAGTSTAPVPSIHSERFGIIQEKLWREPFWLLIAVTFLNKTAGRAATPIFWSLKERYPTPEALAEAQQEDLHDMIYHLGLQTQRSKRLIKIAKAWVAQPPVKGVRFRTLHYPCRGDGKEYNATVAVEEDSDACAGALEIGHFPGCGPYAWDSWRIFCRDVLRELSDDYKGNGATPGFIPEWQKVLPLDKELRACLRWMWLREGWIWDHETGEKRRAVEEEMEKAVQGEMEIQDPQERKFAAQAAGVEVSPEGKILDGEGLSKPESPDMDKSIELHDDPETIDTALVVEDSKLETPDPGHDDSESASDNIVVATPARKAMRRSARLTGDQVADD